MEIRGANIAWGEGKVVDLLNISASPITLEDYAYALAYTCRWRGQTRSKGRRVFYGVAEHCVRGAKAILADPHDCMSSLALAFLGHESDEVPFGDMAGPAKVLFSDYRKVTKAVGDSLDQRFRVPNVNKQLLKYWDDVMLVTEKRDLMGHEHSYISADGSRMVDIEPLPYPIVPYDHPDRAAEEFIALYRQLNGFEPHD